jgi:flagellar biosynthesis protein FlhG
VDQADRLRALASTGNSSGGPRIISITSGKGGVGKTNIAVNTAILMARRGLKTLLVDADIGLANTNLLLGCRPEKSMDDVLFGSDTMSSVFAKTAYGIDLLPGSSGIRKLLELDNFAQRALFDKLFEAMQGYDVVVIDTAPGIGNWVLNFNAAAHDIVVVAHPEPTALADAYALIKVLATERREKKFKLLVNRSRHVQEGLDAFRRLTEVADEFLNISIDLLGTIPEDAAVLKAVRGQTPVSVDSPRAPFSLALDRITDKLLAMSASAPIKKAWNNESTLRRGA